MSNLFHHEVRARLRHAVSNGFQAFDIAAACRPVVRKSLQALAFERREPADAVSLHLAFSFADILRANPFVISRSDCTHNEVSRALVIPMSKASARIVSAIDPEALLAEITYNAASFWSVCCKSAGKLCL